MTNQEKNQREDVNGHKIGSKGELVHDERCRNCPAPTQRISEWEKVVDSWGFDFGNVGAMYLTPSEIVPFPKEYIKSFIASEIEKARKKERERCARIFGSHESPHTGNNCRLCKILDQKDQ